MASTSTSSRGSAVLVDRQVDSGSGWPSFTKRIDPAVVGSKTDRSLWISRTELRVASAHSHLSHVFDDALREAAGLRYCLNSAAM